MGEILFSMNPEVIDKVETKFRRIVTSIPVPESLPIIEKLQQYEPLSMSGQSLVVWDRAKGVNVYDSYGNKWLDMSSGVLVANVGHGRQEVRDAMMELMERPLFHNYLFPCEIRAELVKRGSIDPDGELAHRITDRAIKRGLMLFAPVGSGGATIKICPPLIIDEEAVGDGIIALREAFDEESRM